MYLKHGESNSRKWLQKRRKKGGDEGTQKLTSAGGCWHPQQKGEREKVEFPRLRCWPHLLNLDHARWTCLRELVPRRGNSCSEHFTQRRQEEEYPCSFLLPYNLPSGAPTHHTRWRPADTGAGECRLHPMPCRIKKGRGMEHCEGQADQGLEHSHYFI